ncbi:MAG: serine hydrolase domain-containing protein [Marmoricola sp.]
MNDLQHNVQELLDELVDSGVERGMQVAAYVEGQPVVDAVAGVANPATGRKVESDTVFYNFSIGKGAMATLVHQQVEAGAIGYDTPVAEVWPEFAAHGKQAVTVRHVLTHSAGVPGIPVDSGIDDVCAWDTMVCSLEQAELWWEPGTRVGYHAYTFGYLAGEIVRRVTGRPLASVLREDLASPLGHPDEIWFGVPANETHRLAVLEDAPSDIDWPPKDMPTDLPMYKAGPMALFPTAALGNDPRVIAADIPAGGKVSARAIARMYAALLGEVDGVRLVSPERLAELSTLGAAGTDQVFGNQCSWALGYALGLPLEEAGDTSGSRVIGMAGAGGSWAGADLDRGLALAITKNVVGNDFDAVRRVVTLVFGALE